MYAARDSERRPFFPGYLFSSFPLEIFSKVNNAYGVRKIVRFGASLALVPEDVVSAIREQMHGGCIELLKPMRFNRGDRVMITDGPMRNFEGVFDCDSSHERVRILLDTVGCANTGWHSQTHGAAMKIEVERHNVRLV